jgi:hypothetical protein
MSASIRALIAEWLPGWAILIDSPTGRNRLPVEPRKGGTVPFESPDMRLDDLLKDVGKGIIQLPDFQREFKWDDPRIASLLATVSRGYPIGVVMMLDTGGEGSRFKWRTLSGVVDADGEHPSHLLLDGQQRLTSLYQVLKSGAPVNTVDTRGQSLRRWYYVDIDRAIGEEGDREESIVSVPEDKVLRTDFGRTVVADYSTMAAECAAGMFPLSIVFNADAREDWMDKYKSGGEESQRKWKLFREHVLKPISNYVVPVIKLSRETPKEAVCIVFEKVNTGGVPLNVFELLTATFAGDSAYYKEHGHDFELAADWKRITTELAARPALAKVESTDFLQALTLLVTHKRRNNFVTTPDGPAKAPAISCKRGDILKLTLAEYLEWRDRLVEAFDWCARFLMQQHIFRAKDLPYHSQLVPLAVLRVIIGSRIDQHAVAAKVARWFWCGVLGELYGGTTETRFGRDVEQVPAWVDGGDEPETVVTASFHEQRLLTLRTRQSAAYKGVYALLMRAGCEDWLKKQDLQVAAFFDLKVDIHHVFPKDWCGKNGIDPQRRESIVNKTPLAYDTNRIIGGAAPAEYLGKIERRSELDSAAVDSLVATHRIDPTTLRTNDFDRFFDQRREELLTLISTAMGHPPVRTQDAPDVDRPDSFETVSIGGDDNDGEWVPAGPDV